MPKPVVLFFRFGKNAKYGDARIPASLAKAPCWVHRAEHEAKAIKAIKEPPVPKKDEAAMFAVIEGFFDEMDLAAELCTDVELEDEEFSIRPSYGFRAGAKLDAAKKAFERDGFRVITIVDPLATPKIKQTDAQLLESGFESLEQDLDLASLELVKDCLAKGKDLPHHADNVCTQLGYSFQRNADWLAARLRDVVPGWPSELRDTLRLLVEHAPKEPAAAMRALFAKLDDLGS